jgi:hypothetical protein
MASIQVKTVVRDKVVFKKSYFVTDLATNEYNESIILTTLTSDDVMNCGAKPLFDQHQSSDCLWVEACTAERNCIMASQKDPFYSNGRSCIEYNKERNISK